MYYMGYPLTITDGLHSRHFCAKSRFWREIESGRDTGEGSNVGPVKKKEKKRERKREREREGRKDQKIEVSAPM